MSHVIIMDSKEFLKKFIKKYNRKNFNFLLVSEDIKTNGEYENAYGLKALIPPPNIISEFINHGYSDKYKKKYLEYLSMPKVEGILTIITKLVAVDNTDVILLCSENEKQYKYMNMISKYLEAVYKIKTCKFKDFDKNPDECKAVKNKKKVVKILKEKLSTVDVSEVQNSVNNKSVIKKRLKKLSRKELKSYCFERDIEFKKSDEKEDLIKRIIKKIFG